jgi:hypothetical protein
MNFLKDINKSILIAIIGIVLAVSPALARNIDRYEIWGADQSNSVSGVESRGVNGGWIWVWDSQDVQRQLRFGQEAKPLGCDGNNRPGDGPCDIRDVFPASLVEYDGSGNPTGKTLGDLPAFGRLHGLRPDPQNKYINANIFAPNGGYVGIIDGETKEAIALFHVTATNVGRSVHMSFWSSDGSALLVANLDGKVLERIDITRDRSGKIVDATFNKSAALAIGNGMTIVEDAKVYLGNNGQGKVMMGRISGSYEEADFGELTPNGYCKENGCTSGSDADLGGRPNNVIICPIPSDRDFDYITLGGGGLLVANIKTTPMSIVGEYSNQVFNGAGCGGVQTGNDMWLNAGVAASGAGATQSTFTIYSFNDRDFNTTPNQPNTPTPRLVYKDDTNTATIGNTQGNPEPNTTGQLPGISTRRDAHGTARTFSGLYVHNADRIQNNVEVFNTRNLRRTTYDLTSLNGQGNGVGACAAASVTDDSGLPLNDPAPDLMDTTPDRRYLVVALRGSVPVSVTHAAQGSCTGVGIIELTRGGASGRLVGVLRATNTVDTASVDAPGGHAYTGREHSDVHDTAVRRYRVNLGDFRQNWRTLF